MSFLCVLPLPPLQYHSQSLRPTLPPPPIGITITIYSLQSPKDVAILTRPYNNKPLPPFSSVFPSHIPVADLMLFVLFANFFNVGMSVSLMWNSVGFYQFDKRFWSSQAFYMILVSNKLDFDIEGFNFDLEADRGNISVSLTYIGTYIAFTDDSRLVDFGILFVSHQGLIRL
ncbi:hypothetical protein L2E82_49948 [Cichorium intybus]|nr:hypothetical protein L2E82_49948 [Cichorium intybus]